MQVVSAASMEGQAYRKTSFSLSRDNFEPHADPLETRWCKNKQAEEN